jgi:hypothetical protein
MNLMQDALTDNQTVATVLLLILIDTYGIEAVDEWSAPTIQAELEDDFNVQLTNDTVDKLMAAIAILKSNAFYKSLPDFIRLCNALCGSGYNPGVFDPADAQEIAWGVTEAMLLSPPEDEDPFAAEIKAYISETLRSEGFTAAPDILSSIYNVSNQVVGSYEAMAQEDPELFETAYNIAAEKTSDVDAIINDRLRLLVSQLSRLPLRSGDAKPVVDRLNEMLK